jgi:mannitol-1-phosphate 5-dehydrogenase
LVELLEHLENITYRFSNRMLGITVERLGADPLRKLSENDRLVGPAKLCVKHGIRPVYLCVGIAAAFLYINENDQSAAKVQETISKEGIGSAITKYCSLDQSGIIAETVIEFYNMIKNKVCWEDILEKAEKIKDNEIIAK